jgi:hypothetical protein
MASDKGQPGIPGPDAFPGDFVSPSFTNRFFTSTPHDDDFSPHPDDGVDDSDEEYETSRIGASETRAGPYSGKAAS